MMNTRTSSPPASTASGTMSQRDTDRHRYIKYQARANGTMVSMICHKARGVEGFWYFRTIACHAALSARGLGGTDFKSVVITQLRSQSDFITIKFTTDFIRNQDAGSITENQAVFIGAGQ